jgi:hypothetical protein
MCRAAALLASDTDPGLDLFQVIPPRGITYTGGAGTTSRSRRGTQKPSFFSASEALLKGLAKLTDDELAETLAARAQWETGGDPIADLLSPELLAKLRSVFSFAESGLTTVEVEARGLNGTVRVRMRLTRDAKIENWRAAGSLPLATNWERIWL